MTMKDNKCDVCGRPGAVGVASTVIPYSCAYCVPCLQVNAQPDIVFETMFDASAENDDYLSPAYLELVTWKDDKYIDYKTWSAERRTRDVP